MNDHISKLSNYLTTPELSAETGIPEATLRYYRSVGTGPMSFRLGRRVVYRRQDIDSWIADQIEATSRGGK